MICIINQWTGFYMVRAFPAKIYFFKVSNRNTGNTVLNVFKTNNTNTRKCHWRHSGFLFVTLNIFHTFPVFFYRCLWISKAWIPPRRWVPSPTFVAGDKFVGNYWRSVAQPSSPKFITQPQELSFMLEKM